MNTSRYWLHRVNYEDGLRIFTEERMLTIVFSDIRDDDVAKNALEVEDWAAFCRAYTRVYEGNIERAKIFPGLSDERRVCSYARSGSMIR